MSVIMRILIILGLAFGFSAVFWNSVFNVVGW